MHLYGELLSVLGTFKQCSDILGMKFQAYESSKEDNRKNKSKYLEKLGNIFQIVAEVLFLSDVKPEEGPTEKNSEEEYFEEESYAEGVHVEDDPNINGQEDNVAFSFNAVKKS